MANESGAEVTRQDFERAVVERARSDRQFRAALISDPAAAVRQAFGVEIPPDVQLRVLEETPTTLYIVLPPEAEELSEEDLARVAGGAGTFGDHICGATVAASAALRMR
jgi:hypothetical protein